MNFLLDTNVLSEPTREAPDAGVVLRMQQRQFDYAIPVAAWEEMQYGIARLPASRRRDVLKHYCEGLLRLEVPILPFDQAAADWLAPERSRLAAKGIVPPWPDACIAAIAASRNLTLVTRNLRDFKPFRGLRLQNWFHSP